MDGVRSGLAGNPPPLFNSSVQASPRSRGSAFFAVETSPPVIEADTPRSALMTPNLAARLQQLDRQQPVQWGFVSGRDGGQGSGRSGQSGGGSLGAFGFLLL